ncbi:hypothetical protein Fmac_032729 [Flemingia macrophylla]|uniref:Uncharacterized protein n=1 Tax=Flemingia macrophylla TaxID=520843 RepID=A0ABD1L5R6_9FABA
MDVWQSMEHFVLVKWNQSDFRSKSARAQKNRASEKGGSLHTDGSITIHEHAIRMSQELGRSVHVDEVFHQMHVRKTTGDFVDHRSKRTFEDFEKIFSQAKSEAASCGGGSESSPLDPGVEEKIRNQSWFFAAGGKNKGRVYGVGKVEAGYRCGDNFTQPTTSFASSQKITMLEEMVRKTQEENERLSRKFETLLNAVLPLLPADAAQKIFNNQNKISKILSNHPPNHPTKQLKTKKTMTTSHQIMKIIRIFNFTCYKLVAVYFQSPYICQNLLI